MLKGEIAQLSNMIKAERVKKRQALEAARAAEKKEAAAGSMQAMETT